MSDELQSRMSGLSITEPTSSQAPNLESTIVLESLKSTIFNSPILSENSMNIFNIAIESQDVFLNKKNIVEFAYEIALELIENYQHLDDNSRIKISTRHKDYYPMDVLYTTPCDNKTLDWLFMLNAMNFSLWNPKGIENWTVQGQTGYVALHMAIRRAIIEDKKPLWSPAYYSKIKLKELEIIFRSDNKTTIPLINKRVTVLHEIGTVLLNKFKGSFVNCVELCKGDAVTLLYLLKDEFESYRDTVNYEGRQVFIGSKAVTLIADLKQVGKVSQVTHDIFSTMFVDYRSPQVLVFCKILSYSDRLMARFARQNEPLEQGSREEIEIRCCSLYAFFMLTYCLLIIMSQNNIEVTPETQICYIQNYITNVLWDFRILFDEELYDETPWHNIRSIYY